MAIVRIGAESLQEVKATSVGAERLREREDLQRLLKGKIDVLDPELMVIAEEFGDWEDSRRRIDLLAIDRSGDLVVIELKRDASAHMELQALRYAAMVAPMTFDQVVRTYTRFLDRADGAQDPRKSLLDFLGADDDDEDPPVGDVRVLLVSAVFSKELTTTVLWLNGKGLDIRCVQLQLYRIDEALIADVQQILPVPGTEDYQVSLRDKEKERSRKRGGTMEEFWAALPPSLHPVCRTLVEWLKEHFTHVAPGSGAFVPYFQFGGVSHHIGRFRTDGEIAVYFDWMARKHPFTDPGLRLELLRRLNAIEGIDLPEEKLEKRPRFDLKSLENPASMQAFKEVVLWWLDAIRAA